MKKKRIKLFAFEVRIKRDWYDPFLLSPLLSSMQQNVEETLLQRGDQDWRERNMVEFLGILIPLNSYYWEFLKQTCLIIPNFYIIIKAKWQQKLAKPVFIDKNQI